MKVFPVCVGSGETASLRFDDTTVWITTTAGRWRRLLQWSAGSVLVGLGLAVISIGLTHVVNPQLGLWSNGVAGVLVLAGAVGAAVAGVCTWRAERQPDGSLSAADITAARSEVLSGRVTVTVERADGTTSQFSATGMAGARVANLFARLLAAAAPAAKRPDEVAAPAQ